MTSQNSSPAAGARWRKASCSTAGNNCVEIARTVGATSVRDSKNRDGGHLSIGAAAWEAFIADVKRGRYGQP